jgi:hypothetical protein
MKVQYKAQASALIGGAGSGSLNIGAKGPTKTILTGYIIVAMVRFQAIGEPVPGNQSPFTGCNSKLVIILKTNADTRKMITNLVLEIFILWSFFNS